MPIEAQLLGLLLASVLAGALIAGLVMRSRVSRAFAAGKADSAPEIERLEAQQATQAETIQNLFPADLRTYMLVIAGILIGTLLYSAWKKGREKMAQRKCEE